MHGDWNPDVKSLQRGVLRSPAFGESPWALYEAAIPVNQQSPAPCLMVWLHSQDDSGFPLREIRQVQRNIGRHLFCLVPQNPKGASDGRQFLWGLGYTKAQNKNNLGYVYGTTCSEYLEALIDVVRTTKASFGSPPTLVCGYSMGGFGAFQLGAHAPELFDAVVSVAGHGHGTLEPSNTGYQAPQPESAAVLQRFIAQHAPVLASVPQVLAVHARYDEVSHYQDVEAMIQAVTMHGGQAEMVPVPDDKANSDVRNRKSRRRPSNHGYYYYTLLDETSEEIVWRRIRGALVRRATPRALPAAIPAARDVAAAAAAPAAAPAADGDVVAEAEGRMQRHVTPASLVAIERLKKAHGFGEEVELGLRLLAPANLQKILASDIALLLSQAQDKDAGMLALIARFDADVEQLVSSLRELDSGGGADAPATAVDNSAVAEARRADGDLVARAEARLANAKSDQQLEAIRVFKESCDFGDAVELALRMLKPPHLLEVLSGAADIRQKFGADPTQDKTRFMLWLISQLDPEVESLVRSLQDLEDRAGAEEGAGGNDALMASAKQRLDASQSPESWAAIQRFRSDGGLSDEAELALRMLPLPALWRLLAQKHELLSALARQPNRDEYIVDQVAKVEPQVGLLVRRLQLAEGASGATDAEEGGACPGLAGSGKRPRLA